MKRVQVKCLKRAPCALAALLSVSLVMAAEVSPEQAQTAVGNWIRRNPRSMTARFATGSGEAKTFKKGNKTLFHVVQLEGGGFVVTSGDTKILPIMAFSDNGVFDASPRSPLFALLKSDMGARLDALAPAGISAEVPRQRANTPAKLMSASSGPPKTEGEKAWEELLAEPVAPSGVQRLMSVAAASQLDDVRVEPMIKTEWDQSTWGRTSLKTYNYYTPNNYVCGCVATAGAQIMKYWEYPSSASAKSFSCFVDGKATTLKMKGGTYAWSSMPLKYDSTPNITETQRQAIGKLAFDVGVASGMNYTSDESGSFGELCSQALKGTFGYKSACGIRTGYDIGSGDDEQFRNALLASLDAGMPVMFGMHGNGGHQICADGYGFKDGQTLVHLNCGWSGEDNLWYSIFSIAEKLTSFDFSILSDIEFNIHPTVAGEVVSGRVLTEHGSPVADAVVTLAFGSTSKTVKTNAKGIYSFRVTATGEYSLSAKSGASSSKSSTVRFSKLSEDAVISSRSADRASFSSRGYCANKWGVDLLLEPKIMEQVATPVFSPSAGAFTTSSMQVTLSCDTPGATIYYTVNGSAPTTSSARYTGAVTISSTTTFKAIAVKGEMADSAVASKTYTKESAPVTVTPAQGMDWNGAVSVSSPSAVCGQTEKTHDGVDATALAWTSGDAVEASITVTGPGMLSFWWAGATDNGTTSSDGVAISFPYFSYSIDGERSELRDGADWRQVSMPVLSGTHVIAWQVNKLWYSNAAQVGFLDEVTFVPCAPGSRSVFLDANGADGGNLENDVLVAEFATDVKLPGGGTLWRDGHAFCGWSADPDAVQAKYDQGDTVRIGASDMTLYAVWKPVLTVLAEIPQGGGETVKPLGAYGNSFIATTETPVWAGNFKLTASPSNLTLTLGSGRNRMTIGGELSLTFSAEANDTADDRSFDLDMNALEHPFVVRFHVVQKADVTSGKGKSLVIEYKDGIAVASETAAVSGGGVEQFVARIVRRNSAVDNVSADWRVVSGGEYASISGGTLTAQEVDTPKTVVISATYSESGVDYEGRCEVIVEPRGAEPPDPGVCTVTFIPNGGSGTMTAQTVTKGVATKLNKCAFTKVGHSFKEWSGSDGRTYQDQQGVTLSADLTLTAQWTMTETPVAGPEFTIDANGALTAVDLNGYTEVKIPNGVTSIGAGVFQGRGELTNVVIPNGVTNIGEMAFFYCSGLKSVILPNGVEAIGEMAFCGCSGLVKAKIPSSVASIGDGAFSYCTNLSDLTFPDTVADMGDGVFSGCSKLPSSQFCFIIVGDRLVGLSPYAEIRGGSLPDKITCVDDGALSNSGWVNAVIPGGVRRIGNSAFRNSRHLREIFFEGDAPTVDNFAFDGVNSNCVVYVKRDSAGWGDVPGTWQGLPIQYYWHRAFVEPGGYSRFWLSGSEYGTIVGMSGVQRSAFVDSSGRYYTDGYGATVFRYNGYSGDGIVDAEKTAAEDNDDYWCYPIADMNTLFITGWARKTKYKNVDAMLDYFRKNPRLLRYESRPGDMESVIEGTYGYDGMFDWFKDTTKIDLYARDAVTEGVIGSSFASTIAALMDDGGNVLRLNVDFDGVLYNKKWRGMYVSHGVTCVGYVRDESVPISDPASLKALYIIDSDNDQYVGEGGVDARNSIIHCPVTWNAAVGTYEISGLWGQTATIEREYRALASLYSYMFDANGGTPAKQTQEYMHGKAATDVETPARAGYVFDGWWTDKTGGDRVDMDEMHECGNSMTLYAHWKRTYTVSVKDGRVREGDNAASSSATALGSTGFYLEAADKSGNNMEFAKWTYTPATANLGDDFNPRDPNTSFTMPDAAVTFTANYIAKPGHVVVSAYEVNDTLNEDGGPQGIEWSDDGKVWTPVGDDKAYPVKTGKSAAIQFRSTDPRWTVPAKEKYSISEDEEPLEIKVPATRVTVVDADVLLEQPAASGTVTMNPKSGQVLNGKPVTLTAKPGKDTVFAYWTVGGEKVGYTATFTYAPKTDCTVTAVFRLKSAVADPELNAKDVVPSANAMVGVAFEAKVPLADAAYPAKFSAKGLPSGLKIDAASGEISGVPTKAGDFAVAVTVAGGANGKAKPSITLPISIKPLPAWAQGSFSGIVGDIAWTDGDYEVVDYGSATFTASAAGKISGKVSLYGTNWTFAAAGYDAGSQTEGDKCTFLVRTEMKSGKAVMPIYLEIREEGAPEDAVGNSLRNATAIGAADDRSKLFFIWRGMWKDASTATAAKSILSDWMGVYTLSLASGDDYGSGYLSLTVGKDGNVKATGKLADGTGVSATSPLMYYGDDGFFTVFYSAPTAYKGGAFALAVTFGADRGALGDTMHIARWTSRNPLATGEYGAGFDRTLEFVGAYYDKLEKLYAYYDSLRFGMDGMPSLPYTYKYTYLNENNKKVSESEVRDAEAVDTLGQEGLTVTVNEKGAFVVTKVTKPLQDKDTKEWLYSGANDGALTLSFTQATGIFKGSYTFWYDYKSAYDETKDTSTMSHTSKKVNFEGVMVQGEEEMRGFYLWDATGTYEDEKTGKAKTYKYKESHPVLFRAE